EVWEPPPRRDNPAKSRRPREIRELSWQPPRPNDSTSRAAIAVPLERTAEAISVSGAKDFEESAPKPALIAVQLEGGAPALSAAHRNYGPNPGNRHFRRRFPAPFAFRRARAFWPFFVHGRDGHP